MTSLVVFILLVTAAAASGSRFMPGSWYEALAKPVWTPPNWLFGPVWAVLYLAIAVAGWLIWRRSGGRPSPALYVWIAQLIVNALWSYFFFGLHRPGMALVDIILLLLLIVGFIVLSWPVSRLAAGLFVAYGLWVGFAAALNLALWRMN